MAAPSFSSFPPSFGSFPDVPGPSKLQDRSEDKSRKQRRRLSSSPDDKPSSERKEKDGKTREKHRSKSREQHKSARASADRHSSTDKHRRMDKHPSAKHEWEDLGVERDIESFRKEALGDKDSRPVFFIDRKGDQLNVRYGGLHAGDIPKYKLIDRGKSVLGLDRVWRVVTRNNKGVEVAPTTYRRGPQLTDRKSRALLEAPPKRSFVTGGEDNYKYEEVDGFLRLPSRRDATKRQDYRAITKGEANADSDASSSDDDRDASSTTDSDSDDGEVHLTSHQLAVKRAEQGIATDSSDLAAWFSLLSLSLSTIPPLSKGADKARGEITISVIERAFKVTPRNEASVRLWLKYLPAAEDLWDARQVEDAWEKALQKAGKGPSQADIWMAWLDWRIRRGADGVDGVVKAAVRAMAALVFDEKGRLRVLWRTAVAFRDAGFTERATALFQAEAELLFKAPQSLHGMPLAVQLDALEEFWDAECSRCGEEGARGWAAWVSAGRPENTPAGPIAKTPPGSKDNESDPYVRWSKQENKADRSSHVPCRSTDETDSEDPYAVILFSDIRELLTLFESASVKRIFRLCWLSFLGLHIPGLSNYIGAQSNSSTDDRWCSTHLTCPAYISAIFPPPAMSKHLITADAHAGVLVGREKEYSGRGPWGPVKEWSRGVLGPLDALGVRFNPGKEAGLRGFWTAEDVKDVDAGFARLVFEQCRLGPNDVEWDVLALAFEACTSIKSAVKLSKSFLAAARDSLPHWAAHAKLERLRGRIDDARKVYETVLGAQHVHIGTPQASELWWDWAESEWLAGDADAALKIILRSVGADGAARGIAVLRAKRALADVAHEDWKDEEAVIKLRSLLELIVSSPSAAMAIFDAHVVPNNVDARRESLVVGALALLYHHSVVLKNPMPPAQLRERLLKAVEEFPSNTIILGMFLEAEKGHGVWGRVRGVLGETTADGQSAQKDVARRVAEVWIAGWEKGRWEEEKERTRGGLSAAVRDDRTRGSGILWRIYVEFEIRAGELARAKSLLFRAVAECPLNKELYLLAFGPLRPVFQARELNGWAETMAERGIRLRQGLDEVLEGWREPSGEWKEDDEYGEADVEERARELRRLRPY